PEPIIRRPPATQRAGDSLPILDNKTDSLAHLIDVARGRYTGNFVAKGIGPGEFGNVVMFSTIHGRDDAFTLLRADNRDLYVAEVKGTDSLYLTYTRILNLDTWNVGSLADGSYIGTDGYVEHPEIFTMFDREGRVTGRYGDRMPEDRAAKAGSVAMTAAYQFGFAVSPDGRKVVAVALGDEAAAFFRLEADTLRAVNQFRNSSMKHRFADGQYLGVDGSDAGEVRFLEGTADDEHVYILYDGRQFDDSDWTGNMIWVYDWDGNKVGEYTLSRHVRALTAPDESGRIYAISQDGTEPIIVSFSVR
ncbi:MAG: TolB-like 6-bladed beta-propeller domain-containing protein, partial [Paramuribaculum sp.]|nr:TolB-like 6-bladed beta-propeller domain-containing protein [Paramuribaculum sp.]